ncbi:sodium:solute symporter family protein [bacterium]|jgi:SSS family transporter|nr:sodium:solute symporter family protein [Verrucomicrobiales bacterium]MDC3255572.1 sodium:solute symporter family protein [bacterium]MDF1786238.1 sodium:solute symporter family protein [Verrucomicrobiales bacterium]NCF92200.1 sodium:solute symporter family protein [Verrucomicrobiaceae bacterium]
MTHWQWAQTATNGILGTAGYIFVGGYLSVLVLLGWLGHRAKKDDSLADFYLGGRGLGLMVLLLTLYATQYSGNTMLGFVGKSYRQGYQFLSAVAFMMAIVGFYLIYAPRLHRLAHKRHYVTMGDYLQDRFRYQPLTILASTLGVLALGNYILTNLKALGLLTETITGISGSYAPGVILLAVIMLVYELLGGLRSVAWTDVLQGVLLLFGISIIFIVANVVFGGLGSAAEAIRETRPELMAVPTWKEKVDWLCTVLLVGLGISMYPHAIQRIYAAKSARTLQRSLQIMVFFPLVTTFLMLMLGLLGIAQFPGLSDAESDGVTLRWLAMIVEEVPVMRWIVLICIAAILAATMSTVDSALLAISSVVAKDIYPAISPGTTIERLNTIGKVASFVIMAGAVTLAISLKTSNIWDLIKLKLEFLCQIAPAFLLGIHCRRLRSGPVFAGMIVGTLIAIGFRNTSWTLFEWLPPGILGLGANVAIALVGSLVLYNKDVE